MTKLSPLLPLPNMGSALVIVKNKDGSELGKGFLLDPWNGYFQQFGQVAPKAAAVTGASPFSYTANTKGNFFVIGGTVSNISLIRGTDILNVTGATIIPISIGDTVKVTYSALPAMKFLGA